MVFIVIISACNIDNMIVCYTIHIIHGIVNVDRVKLILYTMKNTFQTIIFLIVRVTYIKMRDYYYYYNKTMLYINKNIII